MKLTILQNESISRIDKFISDKLGVSRSFIQKQIKDGSILVNGESTSAKLIPKVGDIVEITKIEQDKPDLSPDSSVTFNIIDETDEYIIIEKPAGLVVHPAKGINKPTLVNGLIEKYPDLIGVGEDEFRPGIVHRLDKDVSGLMVVARTQKMFDHLKKQFQERTVTKEYTGLVHGVIDDEERSINTPIGRSQTKSGKMAAHTGEFEGDRDAKTEYKVLDRIKNYTLLQVTIHTGRTHQIRVHLNSIEHPVVGDTLYTNKRIKRKNLGRIFLHASKLGFKNLDQEQKKYESELPKDLKTFLSSF
jgi:23S rRNA pseudouridine1911/1915/1917 synthase